MSSVIVYRVAEEVAEEEGATYEGGLIRVADDRDFNVGAALKKGKGKIEVDSDDAPLIFALDAYQPLVRDEKATAASAKKADEEPAPVDAPAAAPDGDSTSKES